MSARAAVVFESTVDGLRTREMQVLRAAAAGMSELQTARALNLSIWTVKSYRRNVMNILNVPNMTGAVHKAHMLGVLP